MKKELYFDVSDEAAGGSLYRITEDNGRTHFYYNHSKYNSDTDELQVFETVYPDFNAFWQWLTMGKPWHFLHPLFVHPDQRGFVRDALKFVNWGAAGDKKWQESHQRQWKKVLEDPGQYYRG